MVPARLSVVTLGARDLGRLREFYRGLGWREGSGSDEEFATFHLGGAVLALYGLGQLADEAAPGEPPIDATWRGVALSVYVDTKQDVDRVFSEFLAGGATPVTEPNDRPWGGRVGFVADPEGNRWEVSWAPWARFDERGAVVSF